ncbi:polysaccharide deacetylase [Bacillus mojavensis]|uniref:polysaccharide deacetylase family protein n=1 Tax=Bacillus mojavensis TaxID=72360 RepID=UPI00042614AE|nr:polysaccharide deacetylase family protein [Bacillus mojavensis]MDR4229108.1 polysaccharide deacetylase [Bacillus mojavensis]MEC1754691.1 polysaccharide deacetylase [Bacillus mojavensis]MEC3587378.1 polysaccharide deacetylase [Bacillus mojavensis]MEC5242568.1 polysaccharide deacetylase [Bacillus mojavensis]MED0751187.1 polysaccharide deacetylase [Bacillus mojavensis]
MSNSPRRDRKLNQIGKIGFGILIILCVTLLCISWKALAGPKQEPVKESTAASEQTHKEKNKTSAQKNEEQKTSPEMGKVVYLTFDDGPNPAASEKIMDLLQKYNAKGTFFMLKPNIERNPDLVRKMVENGHSVGSHGVTHQVSEIYKSPESFAAEMNDTLDFINEITKIKTHLIRAPYGSKPYITGQFREVVKHEHFNLWDWTVDSEDWKYTNGEFVKNTIQQVNDLVGKEPLVVLMHEKPTTSAYLEELLKYFRESGYEMKAIHDSIKPVQFRFN